MDVCIMLYGFVMSMVGRKYDYEIYKVLDECINPFFKAGDVLRIENNSINCTNGLCITFTDRSVINDIKNSCELISVYLNTFSNDFITIGDNEE